MGIQDFGIRDLLNAHPTLVASMSSYDPYYTAATFGGLLTVPELQCNCLRLEALSRLAIAFATGNKTPPKRIVTSWFANLSSGPCGRYEDPAEDLFTTLIITPRGNFRILGGIWESAAFYLQRIVNVVDTMPDEGNWIRIKEAVYGMLKLSDLICQRASLHRYTSGGEIPHRKLPGNLLPLQQYRKRVIFSTADLREHNLDINNFLPFVFDPNDRSSLKESSLDNSRLLYRPILIKDGELVVSLPTAISAAIRMFVVTAIGDKSRHILVNNLANEFSDYFENNPPLNSGRPPPISFRSTANGLHASYASEISSGLYLHLHFVLDDLNRFLETGLAAVNSDSPTLFAEIDRDIEECSRVVHKQPGFRKGLTLIIGCGIGRGQMLTIPAGNQNDWRIAYLSAADVAILNLLGDFDKFTLWRIVEARLRLGQMGVHIDLFCGLMNLIGWVRLLDGHLIQHSQMPEEFGSDKAIRMMIDSTMVRSLRQEASLADRHAVQTLSGEWVEIRKTDESHFDTERSLPLYVCTRIRPDCGPELVFLTKTRRWFCKVLPLDFDRWMIMHTWLPRIATILDSNAPELPHGPLELTVSFTGQPIQHGTEETVCAADIQSDIRVRVDKTKRLVSVEARQKFEVGLASPTNVSEAALVHQIVSGFLELIDQTENDRAEVLQQQIVPNDQARSCHAFYARHFRDFVSHSLPSKPVTVDPIDDATLRLGLGWNVRKREEGSAIEGKDACTGFLNALVKFVEDSLCAKLKAFNRELLIKRCLTNHEAAMQHQQIWRRTAAANMALRADMNATMAVIVEQQFRNNAATQASRILVELAVCECPIHGGDIPNDWDLSQLMALLLLANAYGGWSNAIHLDAMPPSLRVRALGDVHVDQTFFEQIVEPFGSVSTGAMVKWSISKYSDNFEQPAAVSSAEPAFDKQFIAAWINEHGFGIDQLRAYADKIEDYGIQKKQAVFTISLSELRAIVNGLDDGFKIEETLIMKPRISWRTLPSGLKEKEIQPWRFRRRLSLLRQPIVQIDDSEDPKLVIAPGLLRDSIIYAFRGYYEAAFPGAQLKSPEMKSWFGEAARRRGTEFTLDVAKRLSELGWQVITEIEVTKILAKGFDIDYGDVDVLAWKQGCGRLLLIECKELQFSKTPSEVAEQLSDFRGNTRNGKRDLLKKHIDRCQILESHANLVCSYVGLPTTAKIENLVVFRYPVPMLFVWKSLAYPVRMITYDNLNQI